jgi:hypothetical protein
MTMLRSILVALGAAACLFAWAALGEMPGGAVTRAVAGVALGVGVTALVYGQATFAAVALGAASPLAFAALDQASHGAAATAMCLLWLAPRFVLADTRRRLIALVAVSVVAALIAGSIFAAYWDAPFAAHAASCVFAGSCLSLVGTVVQVPTNTAYALRTAADAIEGPTREMLLRAAHAHESSRWQSRGSAARRQWQTLVQLCDRRATLERAAGGEAAEQRRVVDERIETIARELAPPPVAPVAQPDRATPDAATSDGAADEAASTGELDIRIEEPSAEVAEARPAQPTGA